MIDTLREWGQHISSAWFKNKRDIKHQLQTLEGDLFPSSLPWYQEIRTPLSILLSKDEDHWREQSKMSWLRDGDMNTQFFLPNDYCP